MDHAAARLPRRPQVTDISFSLRRCASNPSRAFATRAYQQHLGARSAGWGGSRAAIRPTLEERPLPAGYPLPSAPPEPQRGLEGAPLHHPRGSTDLQEHRQRDRRLESRDEHAHQERRGLDHDWQVPDRRPRTQFGADLPRTPVLAVAVTCLRVLFHASGDGVDSLHASGEFDIAIFGEGFGVVARIRDDSMYSPALHAEVSTVIDGKDRSLGKVLRQR